MTTQKTGNDAIDRLVAESRRLFGSQTHNGSLHVLYYEEDDKLMWADTVGCCELDQAGAGDLADEFAKLDAADDGTYEKANEIVMGSGYVVPGTESW